MKTETVYEVAARLETHPAVRRVLGLNAWKIKTWAEYRQWKRHAAQWVARDAHTARVIAGHAQNLRIHGEPVEI